MHNVGLVKNNIKAIKKLGMGCGQFLKKIGNCQGFQKKNNKNFIKLKILVLEPHASPWQLSLNWGPWAASKPNLKKKKKLKTLKKKIKKKIKNLPVPL